MHPGTVGCACPFNGRERQHQWRSIRSCVLRRHVGSQWVWRSNNTDCETLRTPIHKRFYLCIFFFLRTYTGAGSPAGEVKGDEGAARKVPCVPGVVRPDFFPAGRPGGLAKRVVGLEEAL